MRAPRFVQRILRAVAAQQFEEVLRAYLRGTDSAAGIPVTEENAMRVAAVNACVRVIAETVASLPLNVYQRTDERSRIKAIRHPLYRLLHDRPNSWQTSFEFRELLQNHLCLRGRAYAYKLRVGGEISELIPLNPDLVTVEQTPDYRLVYTVDRSDTGGGPLVLKQEDVLHLRGLSSDGVDGRNVIADARETLGTALAMQAYAGRFFRNDATPSVVLSHPGKLSKEAAARLEESWNASHSGSVNARRTAVIEEGMKVEKLSVAPEDAQFLESRKYSRAEIAGLFRVPPHMIGDLERATFCLPADVEVLTESGPKPIASVQAGERVWSATDAGMVLSPVRQMVCSGVDEILEIRTTNRTLRCNAAHRVLARRKVPSPRPGVGGYQSVSWTTTYVPAGDLAVGETIVVHDGLPADGTDVAPNGRRLSVGFMEFCGHLLGNGHVYPHRGVLIARAENARYMDAYRDIIRSEFVSYVRAHDSREGSAVAVAPVRMTEDRRSTRFASVLAADELTELGLAGVSRTKRVPDWVFGARSDLRLAFVRGFLDADGHVDRMGRASFGSANRAMLSQIRHLCMGLGFPVTNLYRRQQEVTLPDGRPFASEFFTFTCSDPAAIQRIGSHDPLDRARFCAGRPFRRKGRAYPRHGGRGFAMPGCSLARVTGIRRLPAELVYDLEVEETHSFIANGVVVHNSNIEHQAIDFVTHCIRPWLVRWEQALHRDLFVAPILYFPEFNVDALLRGDTASRYNAYAVGRQWGWLSANDIRDRENMNPIEGGDTYLTPANMLPATTSGETEPSVPSGNGKEKAHALSE